MDTGTTKHEHVTVVTLNMEYGRTKKRCGVQRGDLLSRSNPDVVLLQESNPSRLQLPSHYELLQFPEKKMDTCERMDIYVNRRSPWDVHERFQLDTLPSVSPRQSKLVTLKHRHTGKRIRVANVHLVGGRYDENDSLGGMLKSNVRTLRRLKNELLTELVQRYHVDIIAGDFNSDLNCFLNGGVVCPSQMAFFRRVAPGKKTHIYQEWNTAPFTYLASQGYRFAADQATLDCRVFTSIFKNHPDAIWFKSTVGTLVAYETMDFLTDQWSDHNGLGVTLRLSR